MVVKHWLKKELLFVAADTISIVLAMFREEQRAAMSNKQTKTIVPKYTHTQTHTLTHTVVCGGREVTRTVSTPLAMSLLRPSHIHRWLRLVPWH